MIPALIFLDIVFDDFRYRSQLVENGSRIKSFSLILGDQPCFLVPFALAPKLKCVRSASGYRAIRTARLSPLVL